MAIVALPISADVPKQRFTIALDGAVYGFSFLYNTRAEAWMMTIRSADEQILAAGIAVRLGVDLLAPYSDARFPAGRLFVVNFSEQYTEADRDNFGRDVGIVYQEAA